MKLKLKIGQMSTARRKISCSDNNFFNLEVNDFSLQSNIKKKKKVMVWKCARWQETVMHISNNKRTSYIDNKLHDFVPITKLS